MGISKLTIQELQEFSDKTYGYGKYTVLKKYKKYKNNYNYYVDLKCKRGHEFSTQVKAFLCGKFYCQECDLFERRLDFLYYLCSERFEDIECLNPRDFKTENDKLWFRCKKCGYAWQTKPIKIKKGQGCSKCAKVYHYTNEEWHAMIEPLRPDIDFSMAVYVDTCTKVHLKCKICGHEWDATPNKILQGRGCPNCWKEMHANETKLYEFICKKFPQYTIIREEIPEWITNRKRLDITIVELNISIEYQGIGHFGVTEMYNDTQEKYEKRCQYDLDKYRECQENDRKLFYFSHERNIPSEYIDTIYTKEEELLEEINKYIKVNCYE